MIKLANKPRITLKADTKVALVRFGCLTVTCATIQRAYNVLKYMLDSKNDVCNNTLLLAKEYHAKGYQGIAGKLQDIANYLITGNTPKRGLQDIESFILCKNSY